MMNNNIEQLKDKLQKEDMDGIILIPGTNLFYYTGVKIKQSERLTLFIIENSGRIIVLTPDVEKDKFENLNIDYLFSYKDEEGPTSSLAEIKNLLFLWHTAGIEYNSCRVKEYKWMSEICNNLIDADSLLESILVTKSSEEINKIKKAVKILEDSFSATLPYIKPGIQEIEVAALLEYEMKKRGSTGTSFETIVASGYRGASPHGRAGEKVIQDGELIIMDFGSIVEGYVGDISRTISVGKVSEEQKNVYSIVKEAQEYAIKQVRPGMTAHEIDEAARSVIAKYGYNDYFTHRTGHGIGLNAHEMPYIMQQNNMVLQPGMTFTIEPGIYLPEKFGVRIEDNILVTEEGGFNFMTLKKDLLTL